MGLTIRSSRCAAVSMIVFGSFIFIAAAGYITSSIIFNNNFFARFSSTDDSTTDFILKISWHLGYTSLLALITMITGCIGCCASGQRAHRDMCQIVTLFIFSMIVAGLSAYTIYNFSTIISVTRASYGTGYMCSGDGFCRFILIATEGTLLGLAILVLLLSTWAIICCLASFFCHTEVQPELVVPAQQQVVGVQQGTMMQGAVMVPMMRTDTIPVMAPPNPNMMQPVYGMPVAPVGQAPQQLMAPANQAPQQPMAPANQAPQQPMVPANQTTQQPSQAMPMQAVAIPVVMETSQQCNDETVA